jgi:hypothetical protein
MNVGLINTPHASQDAVQHGIIAFAGASAAPLQSALSTLYLPHLEKILAQMTCVAQSQPATDADSAFLMPHEQASSLFGLSPQWGREVYLTPCHWQVGMNEVLLLNPQELALNDTESQAILAAMQAFFKEDGIEVTYESPLLWKAEGDLFVGLPFAALNRAIGQNVKAWLPDASRARTLHRLQSEMQMLLYQHPVNDQRSLQGRWTINAFWVHRNASQMKLAKEGVQLSTDLQEAALQANAPLWQQQWQQLDNTLCRHLVDRLQAQEDVSLTLCSDSHWRHYRPQQPSWLNRLKRKWAPLSVASELRALTPEVAN